MLSFYIIFPSSDSEVLASAIFSITSYEISQAALEMGGRWKGSFIKRNISIFAINLSSVLHTQMVKIFSHKKCISDIRVHLRKQKTISMMKDFISRRTFFCFRSHCRLVDVKRSFFEGKLIKTFTALHSCSSSLSHTLGVEQVYCLYLCFTFEEVVRFEKVWKVNNSHERQQRDLINEKKFFCV